MLQSRLDTHKEVLPQRSPDIAFLSTTAREFCRFIRERDVAAWFEWLSNATTVSLPRFVKHLCRGEAVLLAAP